MEIRTAGGMGWPCPWRWVDGNWRCECNDVTGRDPVILPGLGQGSQLT